MYMSSDLPCRRGRRNMPARLRFKMDSSEIWRELVPRLLQWQHPDSGFLLIDDNQGACRQRRVVLTQGGDQHRPKVFRQDVLTADLQHARPGRMGQGQHGAEIQVVGKHSVPIGQCPGHDDRIVGAWITDGGPMDRRPPVLGEFGDPLHRQVCR